MTLKFPYVICLLPRPIVVFLPVSSLFTSNYKISIKFLSLSGHDTGPGESGKKYRPLFLDHFDKKEAESIKVSDLQLFFYIFLCYNCKCACVLMEKACYIKSYSLMALFVRGQLNT